MTKIAGFDIDEIIAGEEAAQLEAAAAAEKAQRRKELEEKRRKLRKDKGTNPAGNKGDIPPIENSTGSVIAYNNLVFEHPAYREPGKTDKAVLYYNNSLDRLRAAGYERHGRPAEVFGLLCDGLEGKLNPAEKAIFDDMLTSYGEWLSAALQVVKRGKSHILEVYLDPEGLVYNVNKYVQKNFKYAEKREYDITGIPLGRFTNLDRFPANFIQDMYSRPFAELPEKMRTGNNKSQVYLPQEGNICPVGRGFDWFYIVSYFDWASRGVSVVGQKSSTGNEG